MRLTVLPLLYTLLIPAAFADQVVLTNGDRVTGKVVKKEADTLTIKSDLLGEVTVKWKDVTSLTTDAPLNVGLTPDKTVQGTISTAGDKMIVKGPAAAEEAPLAAVATLRNDAEQQRYERYRHPKLRDLWAGYVDFSVASATGNARTFTTAVGGNATRVTKTDKTSFYFNQIYARGLVEGITVATASAVRGGWQYNRNLSKRMFWNSFNDYEHDRFQSLDLRLALGSGVGVSVHKSDRAQLDAIGGGAWNHEQYSTPLVAATASQAAVYSRNSGEIYFGDDFLWRMSKISSLKQACRMFNNASNTGEYRANFDVGIDTKLWKMFSWQVTASDRYITNPAPGRKTNDLLLSSGIRFTFSRVP